MSLKRLETHRGFLSHAINALLRHQEMMAQDNCTLAWATVRRHSEEIFTRLADGHLPYGRRDEADINAVRIEIIAMAGNAPPPVPWSPTQPPTPTPSALSTRGLASICGLPTLPRHTASSALTSSRRPSLASPLMLKRDATST